MSPITPVIEDPDTIVIIPIIANSKETTANTTTDIFKIILQVTVNNHSNSMIGASKTFKMNFIIVTSNLFIFYFIFSE
jgi:hypothetical protein